MVVIPQRPRLRSVLRQRCPECGQGPVFRGAFRMNDCCPTCGYRFERAPGFYLGGMLFGYAIQRSRLDPVPENPMYQLFLIFALPLTLFFLTTFFFTWWMRGKGFGELIGLVRPARRHSSGPGAGRDYVEKAGD
jgi:hypothetical protein